MSPVLVECIPNFSEARRPEVIEKILESITSVPGVSLLDRHSDMDHNRTVVTFIGSPQVVEQAAFNAIASAAQLIDMDKHTGEHPRIGATDVVPFVPISEITMAECIELAHRLGKRVAEELSLPVYLYEEAASSPERQNLENIRRGQYEGLKEEIQSNPERKPDFGPCKLGKAGATVIGARQPLIAYNVYLNSDDVNIAQKIAKALRNSSGGFRYVKAMGILVEGRAQVSMNLTNYRQTPIARVVEAVRREAARYGVSMHSSELVGLAPMDALVGAAAWYLQLDNLEPGQILESRLSDAITNQSTGRQPEPDFLDALASGAPTPGGGAAAAHTAAAAAALVAMVARLTIGKKKYAGVEPQMSLIIEQAETLRARLTAAVEEDSKVFNEVMAASRLPKESPEQASRRAKALHEATIRAAEVPLQVAADTVAVIGLAVAVASDGNLNAISDAGSAGALARAALTSAGLNVRINLRDIPQDEQALKILDQMTNLEITASSSLTELTSIISERGGIQSF